MSDRPPFLLLDPPSTTSFCRRASLREKDAAQSAPFPSIDLILLSGPVRQAGFDPIFIDAQLDRLSWSKLTDRLRHRGIAGLISLTSSSQIEQELAQLSRLKDALGGVPSYVVGTIIIQREKRRLQGLMTENPWLDGVVLNTAEHNFAEIISAEQSRPAAPFNIAVHRSGQVVIPDIRVSHGHSLRIPRPQHTIFKDRRYCFPQSKKGPVTCVQMSFGCPFTCEFCIDNQLYGRVLHRDVNGQPRHLVKLLRREVYFKDLTFGLDKGTTTRLLEEMIDRRLKLRWLCTTRVDVVTPELLALMKRAGCYGIELGVEHAREQVRRRIGKKVTEDLIRGVFAECRRLGIETTAFVMLAFEDDTEDDVRATIRFARSLRPDYVSFNVVNALPGTAYEERAGREGFLRQEPSDYRFMASNIKHRHLTPEQVEELRREALRSFYFRPSLIIKKLIRLRSLFELRKLVRLSLAVG